jgi:hypothetical protein
MPPCADSRIGKIPVEQYRHYTDITIPRLSITVLQAASDMLRETEAQSGLGCIIIMI